MLASAEDGVRVDLRRLLDVRSGGRRRWRELDDGDWHKLVEPCNASYPETQREAEPLPPDPYEAGSPASA
jgi:hypothetical protein